MDLEEMRKEEETDLKEVRKKEMTYLEKVNKEVLPLHARQYLGYLPLVEKDNGKELILLDGDEALEHIPENTPIVEVSRAYRNDEPNDDENDDSSLDPLEKRLNRRLVDHRRLNWIMDMMEAHIEEKQMAIRDFKIFHIWETLLNMKQRALPWNAEFQPTKGKIELEIRSDKKAENETSSEKIADFTIYTKTQGCDKRVTATVGDCMVEYSLISSKACRVKFEIRAYNADGSRARNVGGHVHAVYNTGEDCTYDLFGGENEKLEDIGTLESPNVVILPDIYYFDLRMSLSDNSGNFVFNGDVAIDKRKLAMDEQHYVVGEKGYILLTIFWACLCAELEEGVCTCRSTVIGNCMEENNDSSEDTEEDVCSGRVKRAKARQSSSGEDSNFIEDGDFRSMQKTSSGEDGNSIEAGDFSITQKTSSGDDGNSIEVGDFSTSQKSAIGEDVNAIEVDDSGKATSGEDGSGTEVDDSSTCGKATSGEDGNGTEVDDSSNPQQTTIGASTCEANLGVLEESPKSYLSMGSLQTLESSSVSKRPDNLKICTTTRRFGDEIKMATTRNNDVLIVICFVAKWSDKCKHMEKFINELAGKEKGVVFLTVDIDDLLALAMEWKALTVPMYVLLKRELIVDSVYGLKRTALVDSITKWKSRRMPEINTREFIRLETVEELIQTNVL